MSYQHMDHAGWAESNNTADNRMRSGRKGYRPKPEKLTPFQGRVMDILGMVCGGIYNAPISWDKVEWNVGGGMFVTLRDDRFATFDFYELTALVFLCHEARIRCELRAKTRGYFELGFWQRSHEGGMGRRHPNLAEAVEAFRAYLPADHSITYAVAPLTNEAASAAHAAQVDREGSRDEPLNPPPESSAGQPSEGGEHG